MKHKSTWLALPAPVSRELSTKRRVWSSPAECLFRAPPLCLLSKVLHLYTASSWADLKELVRIILCTTNIALKSLLPTDTWTHILFSYIKGFVLSFVLLLQDVVGHPGHCRMFYTMEL